MSDVTLSAGVRQNLLSLQKTAELMSLTQNRLATGKKVNSALDNPSNFFTSVALQARASDLSSLLDAMSSGIKVLETTDNGLKAITRTVESMQSTVRQARQDKSESITAGAQSFTGTNTSTATNNQMSFDLGGGVSVAVGTYTSINATVTTLTSDVGTYNTDLSAVAFSIDDGTGADAITFQAGSVTLAAKVADINADLAAAGSTVIASVDAGRIKLTNSSGLDITVAGAAAATLGFSTLASTNGTPAVSQALTVTELAAAINANSALAGRVRASIDANNDLRIENLTTSAMTITGATSTDVTGDVANSYLLAAGTVATTSNVRQTLQNQFDDLKAEVGRLADDASFNGINLLAGDKLKLTFNETGTSFIEIQGKNADGTPFGAVTAITLGLDGTYDFSDDTDLDSLLTAIGAALGTLRTQASQYGTNLTSVQNRQDFTKAMINTLQTGADNLVLADVNEEGANMLALQTRQQLSSTALSLSSQADQAVLRLFG
jgi:flagellin